MRTEKYLKALVVLMLGGITFFSNSVYANGEDFDIFNVASDITIEKSKRFAPGRNPPLKRYYPPRPLRRKSPFNPFK